MPIRIGRILAPVVVLAASVGAYALLQVTKPEPEQVKDGPRPITVYTTRVTPGDIALQVITQGEVRARTEIDLVSQVGGRIVQVSPELTEGGTIEPGVSLLKIEDIDYQLALHQAQARVAETEVLVQQAQAAANVARKQLSGDSDASDLALRKPQVAEARARFEAAQANMEQAQVNLSRTNITLPFHGRLISTRVDIGQYISPGTVIGRAFATDVMEIRLPLNDSQLASLGLPIGYKAPAGAGLPVSFSATVAGQVQHWQGQLVRLDASVDPSTRMLFASAEVIDPYGANVSDHGMPLAVGLYVEAQIQGRSISEAYTIPRSALRAGNVVFMISDSGKLDVRTVEVAHSSAQQAVITGGLSAGEQIITSTIRNPVRGMTLATIDTDTAQADSAN